MNIDYSELFKKYISTNIYDNTYYSTELCICTNRSFANDHS